MGTSSLTKEGRIYNGAKIVSSVSVAGKTEELRSSLVAQLVKNPPAMQETLVRFLGQEDPLEKGKTTHSSILGFPWWLSW